MTDRDILGRIDNVGLDAPAPTSKDGGLIDGACVDDVEDDDF